MKTALACITGLWLTVSSHAQELSTAEYPTEDEVFEAFAAGEIEYEEYLQLLEILQNGIDSTELHLLDAVPNLSFFRDTVKSVLEAEQEVPFVATRSRAKRGTATYGYYQRVEEPWQSRYSLAVSSHVNAHWDLSLKVRKDLSGRERVTGRHVRYLSSTSSLRELRIGTFTQRLGLGTVIGYRGKLFDCEDKIDGESFAYPDFGGFNGMYAKFIYGAFSITPLISVQRDGEHRLSTTGGMVRYSVADWEPSIILAANQLARRHSDATVTDYKAAINLSRLRKKNTFSIEYCLQTGFLQDMGTVAMEGTQKFGAASVQLAAWAYGDQYTNLSGGAKATSLRRTERIEELDFSYSEKRTGQEGGLLKTVVGLRSNTAWSNSLLVAARNEDTTTTQCLSELAYKPARTWRFAASVLAKQNERAPSRTNERRVRGEVAYRADNLSMRSYLAHTTRSNSPDFLSWLTDIRITLSNDTRLQLWSNLSRLTKGSAEYWYLFLRTEQQLFQQLAAATKLMYRYDRDATATSQCAFSLEVSAAL